MIPVVKNYKMRDIDYKPISPAQKLLVKRDFDNVFDVCLFGASGVGKTVALIISSMGPQKDGTFLTDRKEYRALFLRRESTLLQRSGLLDAAYMWYRRFYPKVEFNKVEKTFTFPSGAKIFFGGCEQDSDKEKYKGYTELHCVCFEELTQFSQPIYDFICSRLRTKTDIPLRVRSSTNPGDKEEEWVMNRYRHWITKSAITLDRDIQAEYGEVLYYYSTYNGIQVVKDKPDDVHFSFCGIETYINDIKPDNDKFMSAQINDPILRAQLVDGIWGLKPTAGLFFKEEDFFLGHKIEPSVRIRYWDKACSGKKGDFLCGMLVAHYMQDDQSYFLIEDLHLSKPEPGEVKDIIFNVAKRDNKNVFIGFEQEPGSSGKELIDIYKRELEGDGYRVIVDQKRESKENRAAAISPLVKDHKVGYVTNQHTSEMFNQLVSFPTGKNDDVVDSLSGSLHILTKRLPRPQKVNRRNQSSLIPLYERLEGLKQI